MIDPLTTALLLAAGACCAIAWRAVHDLGKRVERTEQSNQSLIVTTSLIEGKQAEITSRLYAHNEELQVLCTRGGVKRYGAK